MNEIVDGYYEAALDRAENRMGAVAAQLSTSNKQAFKNLIAQVPRIQRMETPLEPSLLWPLEGNFVFASLFFEEKNPEILKWTQEIIEAWKDGLAGVSLYDANLSGANLSRANLSRANPFGANLYGANLLDITNWKEIRSIKKANIIGIEYAPDGFREWALENGAVEMEPEEWDAFLTKGEG